MRILVTGGRGLLGTAVVAALEAAGHEVMAAGRRGPVRLDLTTGEGLPEAVADVAAAVHCASDPRGPDPRATEVEGTARLLEAARAAGVGHLVYVSIVGVDRVPYSYYTYKLHAEKVVERGGVPWSILRATQFHPFLASLLDRRPVMIAPAGFQLQPVAVEEVAGRLATTVAAGPGGRLADFGGPQVRTARQLAESLRWARGLRRPVVSPRVPGALGRAIRAGGLTCPGGDLGALSWERWLDR